jgi:hypothetical protein
MEFSFGKKEEEEVGVVSGTVVKGFRYMHR